jgi:hypothetical protein
VRRRSSKTSTKTSTHTLTHLLLARHSSKVRRKARVQEAAAPLFVVASQTSTVDLLLPGRQPAQPVAARPARAAAARPCDKQNGLTYFASDGCGKVDYLQHDLLTTEKDCQYLPSYTQHFKRLHFPPTFLPLRPSRALQRLIRHGTGRAVPALPAAPASHPRTDPPPHTSQQDRPPDGARGHDVPSQQ